jgi:eukaryotic-like serine/threonine-protein kinase
MKMATIAYEDFLTLWKDADRDIPVLQQARAAYERLLISNQR